MEVFFFSCWGGAARAHVGSPALEIYAPLGLQQLPVSALNNEQTPANGANDVRESRAANVLEKHDIYSAPLTS